MGRKKAAGSAGQQASRPFCYFCDRTFDDENILIQHQRAKHFRCPECDDTAVRGKCESVQGLIVHTLKVHSKSLARVPNALQGRDNPELNVYGMDGVPSDVLRQRGIQQHEVVGKNYLPEPKLFHMEAPPPAGPSASGMDPMSGIPNGMPVSSLPGGVGAAPSLEGFQQFLAAQKAPPPAPSMVPAPLPAAAPDAFGGGFPPQAPVPAATGDGHLPGMPVPSTGAVALGNGSSVTQLIPQKRRLEDEAAGEDISVEEKRALLDRYRIPR